MVVDSFNCKNLLVNAGHRKNEQFALQPTNYASVYISSLKNNYLREILRHTKLSEN